MQQSTQQSGLLTCIIFFLMPRKLQKVFDSWYFGPTNSLQQHNPLRVLVPKQPWSRAKPFIKAQGNFIGPHCQGWIWLVKSLQTILIKFLHFWRAVYFMMCKVSSVLTCLCYMFLHYTSTPAVICTDATYLSIKTSLSTVS